MILEKTFFITNFSGRAGRIGRFFRVKTSKNIDKMKELLKVFEGDFREEGFTMKEVVIYGIVAPMVLVVGCVIAEIVDKL